MVGVSTHNLEQFGRAAAASADYIAVGPVFFTSTKTNPDPVIGIDFIRVFVCSQTNRLWPLGALQLTAAEVIRAGADSVP